MSESIKGKKKENKPLIQIHNLIKIYKRGTIETSALRSMTVDFYPGEISVIMVLVDVERQPCLTSLEESFRTMQDL